VGILPVELTEEGQDHWFFQDCDHELYALQWHSAEVTVLPPGGAALVRSNACKVNAMAWGDNAVSVQFHVELMKNTVADWGEIPAYATALDKAMGPGAMKQMKMDADERMTEFNATSRRLYQNFISHLNS